MSLRVALRGQKRLISRTRSLQDPNYRPDEWTPLTYFNNTGRSLVHADTPFYDFLLFQFRLHRYHGSIEGRVGKFLELAVRNIGYISLRSRAYNYSSHYYFTLIHKMAANLLYNVKLQPLLMNKVFHLIQYFHCGETEALKSIIRKPASFKYFWLWWNLHPRVATRRFTYDSIVMARKYHQGDIKIPRMRKNWRSRYLNAFEQ